MKKGLAKLGIEVRFVPAFLSLLLAFLRFILGLLMVAIVFIGSILAVTTAIMLHDPSDEALLSNFHKNKTKFEQLIRMIQDDEGLLFVSKYSTNPRSPADIGITQEQIEVYRRLCKELGIPHGFSAHRGPTKIRLFASSHGWSFTSGRYKGYAYWEEQPDLIVEHLENLDDYRPPTIGESFMVFRHIEGPWYLYFEYIAN